MTDTTTVDAATASATLASMLSQCQAAYVLIAAAQLGLADLLAEGLRSVEALAVAPARTRARSTGCCVPLLASASLPYRKMGASR